MQALISLQEFGLNLLRPCGVDLFCVGKKFLVFNLVSRNLKAKYHRSVLGLFWTLLNPLATTLIFYFVFKMVLNVKVPHYLAFIISGMLPWSFFSQTIMEGMESIVGNHGLISKVPIQIQIFPFVGTVTNFITLVLALPIVIGTAILTDVNLGSSILLFPLYLSLLFLFTYCSATILAVLYVLLRDLRHVLGIVLQLWFYATPILYHESMIPKQYHWILYLNPIAFLFVDIHAILVQGTYPDLHHLPVTCAWVLLAICLTLLIHRFIGEDLVEQI